VIRQGALPGVAGWGGAKVRKQRSGPDCTTLISPPRSSCGAATGYVAVGSGPLYAALRCTQEHFQRWLPWSKAEGGGSDGE
jgi:hypothetical protein